MATSPTSNDHEFSSLASQSLVSPVALNNVILIKNIPLESSSDEVRSSLRESGLDNVTDVQVFPDTSDLLTAPSKCHAIATVVGSTAPQYVELQAGLPVSSVLSLFQEMTTTEFTVNPQYITCTLSKDIMKQAQKLSINVTFTDDSRFLVHGSCCQVYKFRKYLKTYLTHTVFSQAISSPSASSDTTNRCFTGLNPDILLLIPRLAEGRFKAMMFYPEEGRVEILPSSEEEQEQCISQFQTTYQTIIKNRQLKTGTIDVPVDFPEEQLIALLEEFNDKYNQCNFSFIESLQSIKIVSISSRQFDQAKKLISDRISEYPKDKKSMKAAKSAKSSSKQIPTKHGSFEVLNLGNGRTVTVKRNNIATEDVTIIVNAANSQLKHWAGVAGALDKASLGELQKHSNQYIQRHKTVRVGEVAVTNGGGSLKCKYVIHAVGPMASQSSELLCSQLIYQATTNALAQASNLNAATISFPALSTGVFGVNKTVSAVAMFQALQEFPYSGNKLKDIRIVILDEATYRCFAEHVVSLKESTHKDNSNVAKSSTTPSDVVGDTTAVASPPGFNNVAVTQQPVGSNDIHYPELPTVGNGNASLPTSLSSGTPMTSNNLTGAMMTSSTTFHYSAGIQKAPLEGNISDIHFPKIGAGSNSSKKLLLPNQITNPSITKKTVSAQSTLMETPPVTSASPTITPPPSDQRCPICLNSTCTDAVQTNCCKQKFCKSCLDRALQFSCYCPTCKVALKPIKGNQPPGTMTHKVVQESCSGYEGCGTIVITYCFLGGIQGPEHPHPGQQFRGTTRTAYLPNNADGKKILQLLIRAFDAGLVFTIGTSHTTHQANVVVWNDIHHKTNKHGGQYGYPDSTYLQRVKEELKAKGIE